MVDRRSRVEMAIGEVDDMWPTVREVASCECFCWLKGWGSLLQDEATVLYVAELEGRRQKAAARA